MLYNKFLLLFLPILLLGCASSDEPKNLFDAELYSGKPIDTLTNDDPPLSEKEAIFGEFDSDDEKAGVQQRHDGFARRCQSRILKAPFPTSDR